MARKKPTGKKPRKRKLRVPKTPEQVVSRALESLSELRQKKAEFQKIVNNVKEASRKSHLDLTKNSMVQAQLHNKADEIRKIYEKFDHDLHYLEKHHPEIAARSKELSSLWEEELKDLHRLGVMTAEAAEKYRQSRGKK